MLINFENIKNQVKVRAQMKVWKKSINVKIKTKEIDIKSNEVRVKIVKIAISKRKKIIRMRKIIKIKQKKLHNKKEKHQLIKIRVQKNLFFRRK